MWITPASAPHVLVIYEELAIAVAKVGGIGAMPLPNYWTVAELESAAKDTGKRRKSP